MDDPVRDIIVTMAGSQLGKTAALAAMLASHPGKPVIYRTSHDEDGPKVEQIDPADFYLDPVIIDLPSHEVWSDDLPDLKGLRPIHIGMDLGRELLRHAAPTDLIYQGEHYSRVIQLTGDVDHIVTEKPVSKRRARRMRGRR